MKMRFGPGIRQHRAPMKTFRFVFQSGPHLSVPGRTMTQAKREALLHVKPEDGRIIKKEAA